jgi:hypothetical protein
MHRACRRRMLALCWSLFTVSVVISALRLFHFWRLSRL